MGNSYKVQTKAAWTDLRPKAKAALITGTVLACVPVVLGVFGIEVQADENIVDVVSQLAYLAPAVAAYFKSDTVQVNAPESPTPPNWATDKSPTPDL